LRHAAVAASGDHTTADFLREAVCLQCYLRPLGGIDQLARVVYDVDDGNTAFSVSVSVVAMEELVLIVDQHGRHPLYYTDHRHC
jgi:hypothetical protein